MRRLICLAVIVSLIARVATAQQKRWVRSVEYFWGQTDPGPGQGIPVFPADGQFNESIEAFFKNGVLVRDTGLNLINVRVKDQSGNWGPVFKTIVQVGSVPFTQQVPVRFVVSAEYFWNIDPGEGNGMPVLATDGQFDESLEQLFANGLTVPQPGKNLFCIRVKDQAGRWGPVFKTVVLAPEVPQLVVYPKRLMTAAEYFWGNVDPGAGNGVPVLAADGQLDESLEQVYANNLLAPQSGPNLFNIRVKDQSGLWGPLFKSVVIVPAPNLSVSYPQRLLTAAEYFWGTTDPGAGNGTPVLASDGNFNTSLEQLYASNLHAPSGGSNLFNIRVKDQAGQWGPVFKSVVNVDTVLPMPAFPKRFLVAAEYFWGTQDPGYGNGTPILATDGTFDESMEQVYASGLYVPYPGDNLFNVRVKDQSGNWGPVFKSVVRVDNVPLVTVFPKRIVVAGEFFWGLNDPGAGNGVPLLAADGDFNTSLEQFFKSGIHAPNGGLNLFNARLKDQNGHWGPLFKSVVNVLYAPDLQAFASVDSILCHGDSAHVTITASGGVAPYTGTGTLMKAAGAHVFTITDSNGDTASVNVLLTEPAPLEINVTASSIACHGDSSTVVVSSTGGTWPVSGDTTFKAFPGNYSCMIIDANGCRDSASISITGPAVLQLSATSTPILCNGDSSMVTVTASGGIAPYDETGDYYLPAGTHAITVSDANGCESSISVTLTEPPALTGTSTASAIVCAGELSTVQVTASGGTAPYTGIGTVEVPAGLYTYLITDANGCQLVDSITIAEPTPLITNATLSSPIACYGGTGSVSVTASGGTTPYFGIGTELVAEGSWTFAVTDANGCTAVSPAVAVTAPSKVTATYTVVPATCSLANGSISLSVSGGVSPYSYNWSNGRTTSSISGLFPGTYSVVITDANGCTESVTVALPSNTQPIGSTGSIIGPRGACRSTTIVYTIPAVANATAYNWALPAGATGSSTSNSITVTFSSNYVGGFICVTPANQCASGVETCANVPVLTVRPATPGTITQFGSSCGPSVVTCSLVPVNGATSYTWSVAGTQATIIGGQGTNAVQINVPAGFTNARVSVFASNCIGNSNTVFYTMIGLPVANSTLTGQTYVCPNSTQNYSVTSVLGASSYSWSITGSAAVISSNGTSCTVQTYAGWNGGNLTVTATNSCGSSSRSFMLRSVPLQPGAMTGSSSGLCNYNGVTTAGYSIAPVVGATSYVWTVSSGMSIRNVNGTSMTANIDTNFRTGSVCVSPVNACGQGTPRCMAVNAYPQMPGTITGPATVCKSDRAVDYTIAPAAGAYHYLWSISGGAYLVTVSTGLTSTVDFYWALTGSALMSVQSSNLCGNSSAQQKSIAVNLACRTKGGNEMPENPAVLVYPNPAKEQVTVEFNKMASGKVSMEVLDILGRAVVEWHMDDIEIGVQSIELPLNRDRISSGVYMLRLTDGDGKVDIRLVVD